MAERTVAGHTEAERTTAEHIEVGYAMAASRRVVGSLAIPWRSLAKHSRMEQVEQATERRLQ